MKPLYIILSSIIILAGLPASGQKGHGNQENSSPVQVVTSDDMWKAGVWNFNLNEALNFTPGITKTDGEKTGTAFNYNGHFEANYFVINHLAVGAGINFSGEKDVTTTIDPNAIYRTSGLGGNANLIYGFRAANVINIKTKFTVGYGVDKYKNEGAYGTTDSKDNYFNLGLSVGTPLQLQRNVFFTPMLGYNYLHTTGDNFKESQNNFFLGFNMDFYMGCGDDECELSDHPVPLGSRYRRGDYQFGSRVFGDFQIGGYNRTTDNGEGGTTTEKDAFNKTYLTGKGLYYVIDNLGIGASLDISSNQTKPKDSNYKYSNTEFQFRPVINYHLPLDNALKNLYGEAGFGVGFSNSKTDDAGDVTRTKSTVTSWNVGVGYNYFVAERFSLSPVIGYGGKMSKDKDTDTKTSTNGLYAGIEWNFHIRGEK